MYILPRRRSVRPGLVLAWITASLVLAAVLLLGTAPLFDGQISGRAFAQQPLPVQPTPSESPHPQEPPAQEKESSPPPPSYPPLPANSGEGRRIVYSNSGQRVWLVEQDGAISGSWLISGRRGIPRAGTYKVATKSRYSSAKGGALRLEYMVRFTRPRKLWIGFHSIPVSKRGPIQSESQLGTFTSAGCVRQRLSDSAVLYNWAPLGTRVVVTP